jgi:hypothetical protein
MSLMVVVYLVGLEVLTYHTFFFYTPPNPSDAPGKPKRRWLLLWLCYTGYGAHFIFQHFGTLWLLRMGVLLYPIRGNPYH